MLGFLKRFIPIRSNILALIFTITWLNLVPQEAKAVLSGVSNAAVNKGQLTTQLRFSHSDDNEREALDGRFRSRLMTDYGFTDDLALGLFLQGDNLGNDNKEFDATITEARVEMTDAATHGYYSGFRLRYTFKDGDKKPDNTHIRLIAGAPIGKWDLRINQILALETGAERRGGVGIDTRLQTSYFYHPDHRAGLESFNDFGYGRRWTTFDEQNHTVGPVFAGKIDEGLFYETGYRRGLSKTSADHAFKLFITKNF
jgi:hypothetical protein